MQNKLLRQMAGLAVFIFAIAATGVVCAPPSANPPPGGGFGGGTLFPPTGSGNQNRNTSANGNANRNLNANVDVGPNPPTNGNTNQNNNGSVGPPPPGNGNANSGNTNGNSNDNENANSAPPAAPELDALADVTIPAGEAWQSDPIPLIAGSPPLTWSLTQGPSGLEIDDSGTLRWPNPVPGPAPYTVLVVVMNDLGTDFGAFQLTVEEQFSPALVRLSVAQDGAQGDKESEFPSISDDGQRAVFQSESGTLVSNDANDAFDVFLVDRAAGTIHRISVDVNGDEAPLPSRSPKISADGGTVVFQSFNAFFPGQDANNTSDIFAVDVATGALEMISVNPSGDAGDAASENPAVSADGRFVVFSSAAGDLVAGDGGGAVDVFVRDRMMGTTERVSINTAGDPTDADALQPAISRDGRYVAFVSAADNLVSADNNAVEDVFVHDRDADTTVRASVGPGGVEADGPSASPAFGGVNHNQVVFVSSATNLSPLDSDALADVFLHNLATGITLLLSVNADSNGSADAPCSNPWLSADGLLAVFDSTATNLVEEITAGVAQVYVRDLAIGKTNVGSINDAGDPGDGPSIRGSATADGEFVIFESKAGNFSLSDSNGFSDIFLRDLNP